ncbi:MAG: alanine--tRNA ligase [Candidatus Falkowbacteria bacterium]|nr:alanine--tRNA ligase [Candidatus Falkowbacteria bacterium]
MTAQELRQKYLEFFKSKGHTIIPSASLIPENDPTVLFTTAGMHPLVPYLLGEKHPGGKRLANVQKCIRTTDIDEVGDNRHLTFFEMLGNWSLGDLATPNGIGAGYFKEEAIAWSWEFLTSKKWLNLNPHRLYISVFMGDDNYPRDNESIKIWQEQFKHAGIKAEVGEYNQPIAGKSELRIFPLPAKENWWGPAGKTGPCGPCTEMFYDVNPKEGALVKTFSDEVDSFRIMEIWNDVFMEYNQHSDGSFTKLAKKNVDTGMGVERTIAILNNKTNVFASELFSHLLHKLEVITGKKYGESEEINKAMHIIVDHLKAATFIMADDKNIAPSNTDQGYIVRRLIRRALRYGNLLGIKDNDWYLAKDEPWTKEIAKIVIHDYQKNYPELERNANFIIANLIEEENKFKKTLVRGLKELEKIPGDIDGKKAFDLYQTYGFPIEMTKEIASSKNKKVDLAGFKKELVKHRELSRTASAGKFRGGLADAGKTTIKLHTAAHLLLAALRQVLGEQVVQKGSNITAERLRFDFSYSAKMTSEQIAAVEALVNKAILKNLPVKFKEMTLSEAKKYGAMGVFESKYGERVKVYTIGNSSSASSEPPFSREICGGPHVAHTGEIGKFKIIKEESVSAGTRRIRAMVE